MDELEKLQAETNKAVNRIIFEHSERLVQETLKIIYNEELDADGNPIVDAKTKLSAINILLDRSLPKLGVTHTGDNYTEDSPTRKRIQAEIEELVKKTKEN